jgi:hypothetical protein
MTAPPEFPRPAPRYAARRGSPREFDWIYPAEDPAPPLPPSAGGPGGPGLILIPINWAGLPINTGDQPNGLFTCVEDVTGWLDSPPLDGHDADRALSDGSAWGPKVLGAREITITGVAIGPRPLLGQLRDDLAARAADREPADLAITDGGLERTLVASVRAGTGLYRQTWITPTAFRWTVTVHANDPLLYEQAWQEAVLVTTTAGDTGRTYNPWYSWDGTQSGGWWPARDDGQPGPGPDWVPPPEPPGWDPEVDGTWDPQPPAPPKDPNAAETRAYPNWRYAAPWTPNTAVLTNNGNTDAPVYALYEGDLTPSQLTDDLGGIIRMDAIPTSMQIMVATGTLTAEAIGGLGRASFILPGSAAMMLPPGTTRWHLYGAGYGRVTLAWRSAWV